MPVTVYFQDGRPETQALIFLSYAIHQCCHAPKDVQSREARNALKQLRAQLILCIESERRKAKDAGKTSLNRRVLATQMREGYKFVSKHWDEAVTKAVSPALKRLVKRLRDYRSCGDRTSFVWQSRDDPDRPNPNKVLEWYLRDIEPMRDLVFTAYERALEKDLFLHLNICLLPKENTPLSGATAGVTRIPDNGNPDYPMMIQDPRIVHRVVELFLPAEFDEETAFMLPYTAAHEFGVHTLQQVGLKTTSAPSKPLWRFNEGFMDAVVTDMLDRCLNSKAKQHPFDRHRSSSARIRHLKRLTEELPGWVEEEQKPVWSCHLTEGKKAWTELKRLAASLGQARRISIDHEAWARKVALRLNHLPLMHEERDKFLYGFLQAIGALDRLGLPEENEYRIDPKFGTREPLDAYLALFEEILELDNEDICADDLRALLESLPDSMFVFFDL